MPWGRKWQPTSVLLPRKFHGLRSLVGYSPWGRKELDTTEWLNWTEHKQKILRRCGKNTQKNYTKKIFMTQIITMVWSLTQSQTSQNENSNGPWEASLQTKLVEVTEFQLSYFRSWNMMLLTCYTQYASKFGKLSSGHRTGKGQFSFQSQMKAMPKNAQTTAQFHSFYC